MITTMLRATPIRIVGRDPAGRWAEIEYLNDDGTVLATAVRTKRRTCELAGLPGEVDDAMQVAPITLP